MTFILPQYFAQQNYKLKSEGSYFIVENSETCTRNKIDEIVRKAGYSAIISPLHVNEKYAFTVVPYQLPESLLLPALRQDVLPTYQSLNLLSLDLEKSNEASYAEHYTKNKKRILEEAAGLTGTALILGMGNGRDIPLIELARQFDQVVVTDIDTDSMKNCIRQLPSSLQSKVQAHEQDLTGLASIFAHEIDLLPMSLTLEDAVKKIKEIALRNVTKTPNVSFFGKHHFVVSSMVSIQLGSHLEAVLMGCFYKKYSHLALKGWAAISKDTVFHEMTAGLCVHHLVNLFNWTLPQGKIYYAEVISGCSTNLHPATSGLSEWKDTVVSSRYIQASLAQLFLQTSATKWVWESQAPTQTTSGSLFCFQALGLKPIIPKD